MAAPAETVRLLAERIRQLESSFRLCEPASIPLGSSGLKDLFPEQGLAAGSLVELLPGVPGAGAWTFALLLASYACGERKTLVIADPERCFYPPAAHKFGLEASRIVIVRPRNARDALLALGQALRCPANGTAIGEFERLQDRDARRLQLAAECGGGLGVLLRPASALGAPSFASVRLLMHPLRSAHGWRRVRLEVLRCRATSPLPEGEGRKTPPAPLPEGEGGKCCMWRSTMPRVMCVHFPHWSLQRIRHHQPDLRGRPLALMRPVANKGGKVAACCGLAHAHGVRPGMLQAEALATAPALTCLEEDLDADRQVLTQLAQWAQRFSPVVGLEEALAPACLFIDTTGCASCFGGEEALVQRACAEFSKNGWTVALALADTLGAAWALAHCGELQISDCRFQIADSSSICNLQSAICNPLASLPVAALRLSAGTLALLEQFGIERIGQLAELPRDQIAERFGAEVGLRLDQASGRIAEVIAPFHPQPEAAASWIFDDPVERHEIVARVLDLLLERLQAILEKRHCGARLVECVFELDGAKAQRFECSLSRPARTASYLSGLLRARLEQVRVEAPIRAMCVRAVVLERFAHEQPSLFDAAGQADEAALTQLLDSLASRLGKDVVTTARFRAEPQPELACRFVSALQRGPDTANAENLQVFVHRPLRLFPRPIPIQVVTVLPSGMVQRFHGAGVDHAVVGCQGPERIETGWWRGGDIQRDYFMVETSQGTRWWIFQRLDDGRWFLHGCFD